MTDKVNISDYIADRLKGQQEWYEKKASSNKRLFMNFQTIVIILGALIPLLVVLENSMPAFLKFDARITSAVISAVIAILAGIDKLRQPQANWFNYRANEEMLKKEQWMFEFRAGPYRNVIEEEVEQLLVERVESIISADIARFTQVEHKDKKPSEAESETKVNGKPEGGNGDPNQRRSVV